MAENKIAYTEEKHGLIEKVEPKTVLNRQKPDL
jgi:hypothetical protein